MDPRKPMYRLPDFTRRPVSERQPTPFAPMRPIVMRPILPEGAEHYYQPLDGVRPQTSRLPSVANWSEIWTEENDMGTDRHNRPQLNAINKPKALPDAQLEYLKQERPGELWRNIQFFKKLEIGSFGAVWDVTAERRTGSRWEAPTLLQHKVDSGPRPWMNWKKMRLACKVMICPHNWANDWQGNVETMLADMHALRYLKHENIVQFYDIIGIPDSQTGFPYAFVVMLMELCNGNLFALIANEKPNICLNHTQTIAWLRQIASALQYLHVDKRTVHLDIKPENILYVSRAGLPIEQWIYKLTDFGMAISYNNNIGDPMVSAVRAGTDEFNPDELNVNWDQPVYQPVDTSACDIYALGGTVANSLLGINFTRGSESAPMLIKRMISGPHLSRELYNLAINMLAINPQNRPTIEQVCNRLAQM
ncbi:probable serine/threonine-protein kinase fhkA [Oppia nitens]|uniref:probable serine/threonine-protein kinase fhkA n=1 Tax=Oppia nitens TaxID=1686743 RepID=UPI0023DB431C|nr:probable serine/threonine-protein kinase fhkA [Oppia nitens]